MTGIWLLFKKDLLRRRRAPLGVLVMIAFPLAFAGLMALLIGGGGGGDGDEPELPRVLLLFEDHDGGPVGEILLGVLTHDEMPDFLDVVEVEDGKERMERGEAAALLVVPKGTTWELLRGRQVRFELVRNPAQVLLPEIAEQFCGVMTDVLSLASLLLAEWAGELGVDGMIDLVTISGEDLEQGLGRLKGPFADALGDLEGFVDEPPIGFARGEAEEGEKDEDEDEDEEFGMGFLFLLLLPGLTVYALFIIGDAMMRDLLEENTAGTLRRQLVAPVHVGHLVAAKVLVAASVAFVALLVLAAVAAPMVTQPVSAVGFLLVSLALILAITGMSSLIYGAVSSERQGAGLSALLYLVLAFSGGSFIRHEDLPAAMQAISPVSPFYWGTQGFLKLLDGGVLADVLRHAAVLGGTGLLFLAAGSWLLQRKLQKGAAA